MKKLKKQIMLITLTLLFLFLTCNAVSATSVNNSTQSTIMTNNSNANSTIAPNNLNIIIKGKVTKCSNGNDFPDATITISKNGTKLASTTTKSDGTYTLNFQSDQTTFTVTASYPGHKSSSKTSTIINSVGTENFQLGTTDVYVSTTGSDTTGDGTKDNPYATIQTALGNVVEGGTVHLQAGTYTGTGNTDLYLSTGVTIAGESQTNTIINAQGSSRIFTIDANVILTNLTLANGTSVNGGAIYNKEYAVITLNNCTFVNNTVTNSGNFATNGGAIYNYWGTLNLNDCTFTGNSAIYNNGGAIYNYCGAATLNGCNFTNNSATYGSAIYNYYSTLNVNFCNFTNNSATQSGTICNQYGTITTVGNCNFINNTAATGSAIHNYKGIITDINSCTFTGNNGNAIYYNSADNSTLSYCNFINNIAYDGGSAIYNYYGTLDVNFCNFTGNNAQSGGAIYNMGNLTVCDCTFINNTATGGGAIYNGGTITIPDEEGSTFTCNHASNGGAIYNTKSCVVYYGYFVNNTAIYGGAVYNGGAITASNGCTFTCNHASNGGAVYNTGYLTAQFNRIFGNTASIGNDIYNINNPDNFSHTSPVNIEYNWWGSNANPSWRLYNATIYKWLVLTVTASPTLIKNGGVSTITVDLLHDNTGVYHDPANGSVPYWLKVTSTATLGTINSSTSLVSGVAKFTFKAGATGGKANISVKCDNQTVTKSVTIDVPPKVTSTNPKNGATGFSRTATITIKLSENIRSSINWSKIYVKNLKTGKIVVISKSIKGSTLYIKMSSKRYAYNWYRVYIPASAVKDNTNNNLASSYVFNFKTGKY